MDSIRRLWLLRSQPVHFPLSSILFIYCFLLSSRKQLFPFPSDSLRYRTAWVKFWNLMKLDKVVVASSRLCELDLWSPETSRTLNNGDNKNNHSNDLSWCCWLEKSADIHFLTIKGKQAIRLCISQVAIKFSFKPDEWIFCNSFLTQRIPFIYIQQLITLLFTNQLLLLMPNSVKDWRQFSSKTSGGRYPRLMLVSGYLSPVVVIMLSISLLLLLLKWNLSNWILKWISLAWSQLDAATTLV